MNKKYIFAVTTLLLLASFLYFFVPERDYGVRKEQLIQAGWEVRGPDNSFGNTANLYPEIICNKGDDTVCQVIFTKNGQEKVLKLKASGDSSPGYSIEFIVVGEKTD